MKSHRLIIFLSICLLIFYGNSFGQKNTQKNYNITSKNLKIGIHEYSKPAEKYYSFDCIDPCFKPTISLPPFRSKIVPVQQCYYFQNLSIICRTEWKLEKVSPIAIRLRLGSLEHVNYLEGKPNSKLSL